jgi:hypothetical protein
MLLKSPNRKVRKSPDDKPNNVTCQAQHKKTMKNTVVVSDGKQCQFTQPHNSTSVNIKVTMEHTALSYTLALYLQFLTPFEHVKIQ